VEVDPDGLSDALADLAERVTATSDIDCRFEGASSLKVQDEVVALHLYRIAQEAVHNAIRHGRPRAIAIRLQRHEAGLVLSVSDDGAGIGRVDDNAAGLGLRIMRYRAGIIGGEFTVEAGPDGGTLVRCLVPARR
jgi:signal transduction histidine kinase